jgi:hypothetical protein
VNPAPHQRIAVTPTLTHHNSSQKQEHILASNHKHHHVEQHERFAADEDETSYPAEHQPTHRYQHKQRHLSAMTSDPADPCEDQDGPSDVCGSPDDYRYDGTPSYYYYGPPQAAVGIYGVVPWAYTPFRPLYAPDSYIVIDPHEDPDPGWHW